MDLLGIGRCVLDHVYLVERHPQEDSKVEAVDAALCGGGPVATACVAAARLGLRASFMGFIGDDWAGRILREEFEEEGVDQAQLETCPGRATPTASIWTVAGGGRRTVVLHRGDIPDQEASRLKDLDFSRWKMLLLDGNEPLCQEAAEGMRAAGGEVMLDLGGPRENPLPLIERADIVAVSKAFVMHQFPEAELLEAAAAIRAMGPRLAVITLGPGGAVANEGATSWWFPAWPPPETLDGTGAGDVYHGALAWALLRGLPTRQALASAAIAGGMACRRLGGRAGAPNQRELQEALAAWKWE